MLKVKAKEVIYFKKRSFILFVVAIIAEFRITLSLLPLNMPVLDTKVDVSIVHIKSNI
jgi:hypothetical protein